MGFCSTVRLLACFLYASEILNHIPVLKLVLATKLLHKTDILYTGEMADQIRTVVSKGTISL